MRRKIRFGRTAVLLAAAMAAPVAALLLAAGCQPGASHPVDNAVKAAPPTNSAEFVGSAACAGCHPGEYRQHRLSRHAATLQRADIRRLGQSSPPVGPIPDTPYEVREESGEIFFARSGDSSAGARIQYALGSGKTAVTYIGAIGAERLTEFRMSYDPTHHRWFTTPGQVDDGDLKLGTVFELGMAKNCILCHADKTAPDSAEPASGFLGVGCESCHGPGGPHIAAVKSSQGAGIAMEKMGHWSAARIDALCARCHRSVNDVALDQYDATNTARFQPYSLELSPCFKKSGGRLSCITCHDAHSDASTDPHYYEKICLSCHSTAARVRASICPVNQREKCIGCHMPKRPIFPSAHVPLTIADHLIWAYRPGRQ